MSRDPPLRILYVEDELIKRTTVIRFLTRHHHEVLGVETAEEALRHLAAAPCDVLITDIRLPGMDGSELLAKVRETYPDITVLVVTAYATVDVAVEVMRRGAHDFLTKPFRNDVLHLKLQRVAELRGRTRENAELRRALEDAGALPGIIGNSPQMLAVAELVRTVAAGTSTVLLLGESGTGKELVARAIHLGSGRSQQRLVAFHCASLPPTLVESELFGHEKGAFTGATARHQGRFERANGGTLLLDDIDAMPLAVQAKLLRVIEEREVEPVGGAAGIALDVRLIASARPDLKDRVSAGEFREDLYFRLNVIPVVLPPLRERREDIEPLTEHFLAEQTLRPHCKVRELSADALTALRRYPWPGNVRELRNLVERLCWTVRAPVVDAVDLPGEYRDAAPAGLPELDVTGTPFPAAIARVEQTYFAWAMKQSDGNIAAAARLLGVPRSTLSDRLHAAREEGDPGGGEE